MVKKLLRLKYLTLRDGLSASYINDHSLMIANALLKLPIWDFQNYHVFLPIEKRSEIDTEGIIATLLGMDKNVIVPKTVSSTVLAHYLLTDNTRFTLNKWGIPEPVEGITVEPEKIDVVFIPLLAYDLKGNRIGYGKGFYDRFLAQCRPEVVKIGLSFFDPEQQIEGIELTDVSLDYCVTPHRTYSFKPS